MKITTFFLLTIFFSISLYSQQAVDVIEFKNGNIYKGTIISDSNDVLIIKTLAQNTLCFDKSEIISQQTEAVKIPGALKTTGYYNFTSFGVLMGSTANDEVNAPLSILTENNYRFHYISFGITTGLELLNEATVPLAFNLKGMLPLPGGSTFYLGGTVGHSYSVEDPVESYYEIKNRYGGVLAGAEAGILFPAYGHTGMFISAGYRYNELSYTRSDGWRGEVDRTIFYNRISLRVGLMFF